MSAANVGSSVGSESNACATASIVTSSCVGPTPPLVKTTSWLAERALISPARTESSSCKTRARSRRMPSARSVRASSKRFASWTLPLKSSLPTSRTAAVSATTFSIGSLGLELLHDGVAVLVDAHELLDTLFRGIEARLRRTRETNALLEERERFLEAELAALELL